MASLAGVSGGAVRKGRAVTGAANVAFLFLLLTGPVVVAAAPAHAENLTENLVFRRGVRGRRGNSTGTTWWGSGRSSRWW